MSDLSKAVEPVDKVADLEARSAEQTDQLARLARIEAKLGVPAGYYQGLRDQGSDWEFAIKLVVLLEAALGHVIAATLQNNVMRDHCERLNLVGRTGKLDLAHALGILSINEVKAFATLAETRNRFAHKVANINSDLPTYAAQLIDGDRDSICKRLLIIPPSIENDVAFLWKGKGNIVLFRFTMWMSGSLLLYALATQDEKAEKEEAERRRWNGEYQNKWTLADLRSMGVDPAVHEQWPGALNQKKE
ncbi:MAG: hypothetical protein K0M67_05340 [Thiobacillus sp.]|nr:hypothetical protein [Thiobacillus sp.]